MYAAETAGESEEKSKKKSSEHMRNDSCNEWFSIKNFVIRYRTTKSGKWRNLIDIRYSIQELDKILEFHNWMNI